jgi:hypothetical protein
MKKQNLKSVIATASLALGLSAVVPVHADTFGGALGNPAASTDVYAAACPIGTTSVSASVNDGATAGVQINVQLINPQGDATSASAPDNGAFSPVIALAGGGAGSYLVTVDKNSIGVEGYAVTMDCLNVNGKPLAGNQFVQVQNQ